MAVLGNFLKFQGKYLWCVFYSKVKGLQYFTRGGKTALSHRSCSFTEEILNGKLYFVQRFFLSPCNKEIWIQISNTTLHYLNLSRRRSISYRNQFIDLLYKSMDWFLYDISLCRERVKECYKGFSRYVSRNLFYL